MAYATPQRFAQEFGLEETSQLMQDTQRLVTADAVQMALAGTLPAGPTSSLTQAQLDAVNAGMARLVRKLSDMSNFMDGYLRSAVVLPLPANHRDAGVLEECCLALVRESLSGSADNATDAMKDVAARWRAWLVDVQKGRVQLVDSATGEGPVVRNRYRTGPVASRIDWDFNERFGRGGGAL
jgi:phage gp36-like protein